MGMVGVGYRQHPNGRPALGCSLVAISHGPSPQGSLSRGSQPCGIAPNPTPVLKLFPPDRDEKGLEQLSN